MTISAPTDAPCSKPMMSGEPSGLRVSDWKTAPEIAERDADQQRAERARQAQVADDEGRAGVAAAGQRRDARRPARSGSRRCRSRQRTGASTDQRRRTAADHDRAGARTQQRRSHRRRGRRGRAAGAWTSATTPSQRRDPLAAHERDEHGRADHGDHHARLHLARAARAPARSRRRSAAARRRAPPSRRAPSAGRGRRARAPACGTVRPRKYIGPAAAVAAPHSSVIGHRAADAGAADARAERAGGVVAERERVQRPRQQRGQHQRRRR